MFISKFYPATLSANPSRIEDMLNAMPRPEAARKMQPDTVLGKARVAMAKVVDRVRVYDVPEKLEPTAISLERVGFIKVSANLRDTTGVVRARDIYVHVGEENWKHILELPSIYQRMVGKNHEQVRNNLIAQGGNSLGAVFGVEASPTLNLTTIDRRQGISLQDVLPYLEISIENPGYKRGSDVDIDRLLPKEEYVRGSVRFSGMDGLGYADKIALVEGLAGTYNYPKDHTSKRGSFWTTTETLLTSTGRELLSPKDPTRIPIIPHSYGI